MRVWAKKSRGHHRRWTPVVLAAAAALSFASEARADDLAPLPLDAAEVAAVVTEIEATVETAVGATAVTAVASASPADDVAAAEPTPVETAQPAADTTPEPAAAHEHVVLEEAPVTAPLPVTAPEVSSKPAAGGDTGQYHPAEEPSAAPESTPTLGGGPAPDQWTWIWNWNCADSVEMPAPTGSSWTWIWTWNCPGMDRPAADLISVTDSGEYQPQSERYQDGNDSQLLPTNFNVSIRILSPGDDGSVTQLNSAVSASATNLSTTIVQTVNHTIVQTVHQTVDGQAAAVLSALGELAASVPSPFAPVAAGGWPEAAAAALPALLQAELGGLLGDGEAASDHRGGAAPRTRQARSIARLGGASLVTRGEVPSRAGPLRLEAAVPVAERTRPGSGPVRSDKRASLPFEIMFPSPVASAGGAASGGAGGAFAAFLLALALAYLVIPPDIRRRVKPAESRPPRGVDLGGDERPG